MSATTVFGDRVWTPAEIDKAIGDDENWRRYEIVDGVLVVSPPSGPKHDLLGFRMARVLDPAVPDGFVVTTTVGIDLGRSYRVTDATVVRAGYVERGGLAAPSDVLLAVEVESPTSTTTDRITKPAQYAAVGIPFYWRLELGPVRLNAYRLTGDVYEQVGSWGADEAAVIAEPFDVTIELSTLLP